jgi:hypothetical protein
MYPVSAMPVATTIPSNPGPIRRFQRPCALARAFWPSRQKTRVAVPASVPPLGRFIDIVSLPWSCLGGRSGARLAIPLAPLRHRPSVRANTSPRYQDCLRLEAFGPVVVRGDVGVWGRALRPIQGQRERMMENRRPSVDAGRWEDTEPVSGILVEGNAKLCRMLQ